ncbi:MAG: DNA-binding response regulator [Clostridia bacterium]|nr:DNA-binding response regulator [Clostridia bacterium]
MYRVMIVDDERYIRNGIVSLIDWASLGCRVVQECANGLEAAEYIGQHKADIVICDIKMPGMDGLAFAEYVKQHEIKTKVIILTAYSEFHYAQTAIRHGVTDFIIKTEFLEELPKSVEKTIEIIESEKQISENIGQLKETIQDSLETIKEKFILQRLQGITAPNQELQSKRLECGLEDEKYCLITMEMIDDGALFQDKEHQTTGVFNIIKNFVRMVFKEYRYIVIPVETNSIVTLLYLRDKRGSAEDLIVLCHEILLVVEEFMRFHIKIGISDQHDKMQELNESYKESLAALAKLLGNNNSVGLYTPIQNHNAEGNILDIHKYINKAKEYVRQGNGEEAKKQLQEMIQDISNSNLYFEQAKTYVLLLCSSWFLIIANYDISNNDYHLRENSFYQQINQSKSLESLLKTAENTLDYVMTLCKDKEQQKNVLVRNVNRYIRENYSKNISLNTIASHLYVSSSYLSRLYKKETGESVIESLNKYRIEVAKNLLKEPDIKIFEVGTSIGIEDPAYFTHVFTKFVGLSPREFRLKHS